LTRVVLLADGGPEAGLGHVSRTAGLAAALRERGVEAETVVLDASEPVAAVDGLETADAIILDSYRVVPADLPGSAPLVVFHDFEEPPAGAALVIGGTSFEHACLRPEFWNLPAREIGERVESVVVATGAGGVLGVELASAVRAALPAATVSLVRGPYAEGDPPSGVDLIVAPTSLAEVLSAADVAVVGAGQTMLEAAAAGTPTIAVALVENQRRQAHRLAELGGVELSEPGAVAEAVVVLAADQDRRRSLSARAQAVVDGQGARRVAALVEDLT
jgi:UDP-2,4-diacetamido-2,4,6-trideoxy-beta-L-altropyranose hydrolase